MKEKEKKDQVHDLDDQFWINNFEEVEFSPSNDEDDFYEKLNAADVATRYWMLSSEEEKEVVANIFKKYGFTDKLNDVLNQCAHFKKGFWSTYSFAEESAIYESVLYSNVQVLRLIKLMDIAEKNLCVTINTRDKRGNTVGVTLEDPEFIHMAKHAFIDFLNSKYDGISLAGKRLEDVLSCKEKELKNMLPNKYDIGWAFYTIASNLKDKGVFKPENKILAIKEACLLYDLLALFEVIRPNEDLDPKEKFDFIKNQIKLYQGFMNKKAK